MDVDTLHIIPEEVVARKGELEVLASDTSLSDALTTLKAATALSASSGTVCSDFRELIVFYESFVTSLDLLISRSILLLSDTEKNFVDADNRLAAELGRR